MSNPQQHDVIPSFASQCSLVYSVWIQNWFVIEPYRGTGQPEGSTEEWRKILIAMKERQKLCRFRRIGMEFDADGNVWFWSPRNSMDNRSAMVPASDVDAWIARAEKILDAYTSNVVEEA